jgi:hypothetical protein
MPFSITKIVIMEFSIMALSLTTLSIMTLSKEYLIGILSMNDTQHNHTAIMQSVIMLSVTIH